MFMIRYDVWWQLSSLMGESQQAWSSTCQPIVLEMGNAESGPPTFRIMLLLECVYGLVMTLSQYQKIKRSILFYFFLKRKKVKKGQWKVYGGPWEALIPQRLPAGEQWSSLPSWAIYHLNPGSPPSNPRPPDVAAFMLSMCSVVLCATMFCSALVYTLDILEIPFVCLREIKRNVSGAGRAPERCQCERVFPQSSLESKTSRAPTVLLHKKYSSGSSSSFQHALTT